MVIDQTKLTDAAVEVAERWVEAWGNYIRDVLSIPLKVLSPSNIVRAWTLLAGGNPVNLAGILANQCVVAFKEATDDFADAVLVSPFLIAANLAIGALRPSETDQRVLTAKGAENAVVSLLAGVAADMATANPPQAAILAYSVRAMNKKLLVLKGIINRIPILSTVSAVVLGILEALFLTLIRITVSVGAAIGLIVVAYSMGKQLEKQNNPIEKNLLSNQNKRTDEAVPQLRRRIGGVKP